MSKTNADAPKHASPSLPALPLRRRRRRSVRASHSWCWRRPPSRKRVAAAQARPLPERAFGTIILPIQELHS